MEDQPWWEVDLGQPAVIERVRVWNRTDVPHNPSKRRDEYTSRLFPFWILISEFPFKDLKGKEGYVCIYATDFLFNISYL